MPDFNNVEMLICPVFPGIDRVGIDRFIRMLYDIPLPFSYIDIICFDFLMLKQGIDYRQPGNTPQLLNMF